MAKKFFSSASKEMQANTELKTTLLTAGVTPEAAGLLTDTLIAFLQQFGEIGIKALIAWLTRQQPPVPPAGT